MGLRHALSFAALANTRRGNTLIAAAAMFALGVLAGSTLRLPLAPHGAASIEPALAAASEPGPLPPARMAPQKIDPRLTYPADVVRVIDGDTFEARVQVWPGIDVDTKVRLRGIDAPELHSRCADEHMKAEAARAALETMLADGGVAISQVGIDKYGGRVDAAVATRSTADVSAALLNGGFARSYDGRKRGTWC